MAFLSYDRLVELVESHPEYGPEIGGGTPISMALSIRFHTLTGKKL
jgi:hypothetical protein